MLSPVTEQIGELIESGRSIIEVSRIVDLSRDTVAKHVGVWFKNKGLGPRGLPADPEAAFTAALRGLKYNLRSPADQAFLRSLTCRKSPSAK
jgi:hypothetical protein